MQTSWIQASRRVSNSAAGPRSNLFATLIKISYKIMQYFNVFNSRQHLNSIFIFFPKEFNEFSNMNIYLQTSAFLKYHPI